MGVYLGVFDGHNAAAAVFFDGRCVAALQEERLNRIKNYHGIPEQAVRGVLQLAGLRPEDVSQVWIASNYISTPRPPEERQTAFDDRHKRSVRQQATRFVAHTSAYRRYRARQRMEERRQIVAGWGFEPERVHFSAHHATHAAAAYYGLRQDDDPYLILTLDGGGDGLCGSVWTARNGKLEHLHDVAEQNSLGEIYAVTTHMLGFVPLEHEYKLMGMAPYAARSYADKVAEIYHGYLDVDSGPPPRWRRKVPEALKQIGPRLQRDLVRVRFDNICAGLQRFTEDLVTRWVRAWVEATGIRRVLVSGGVFMNVKANKAVSELDTVDWFEAFPSCGDESLALGTCYMGAQLDGQDIQPLQHYYLGPEPDRAECEAALQGVGGVELEQPADMAKRVAQLLAEGHIVARAAGPMEFGARALGNRSILADPIDQDVVRVVNQMIKKRDFWMPFAPVVKRQHADRHFVNPKGLVSPYMMNTFDSTETRSEFMAAVHTADLTARPQIVEAGQNPAYEAILDEFTALTGRHVLLNTSFNLHGEPIVCSAADAVRVLLESGLERLILGPYLVTKKTKT